MELELEEREDDALGLVGDTTVGTAESEVEEGSESVVADCLDEAEVVVVGVAVDVFVAEEDCASVSISHMSPPLHLYPKGQQESPHLGRSSSSRVVLIAFV